MLILITRPIARGQAHRFITGLGRFLTSPGSPCLDQTVEGPTGPGLRIAQGEIGTMQLNYNDRLVAQILKNAGNDGAHRRITIEGIQ